MGELGDAVVARGDHDRIEEDRRAAGEGHIAHEECALAITDLADLWLNFDRAGLFRIDRFALSDRPTATDSGSVIAFIDASEGYEVGLIQRAK